MVQGNSTPRLEPGLVLMDNGSTVTCITNEFVTRLSLKIYNIQGKDMNVVSMFGGNESNNRIAFVSLSPSRAVQSNDQIHFPALIIEKCEAMSGADILIGNDVIGKKTGLGFNTPMDGPAEISFYRNQSSKQKEKITYSLEERFGGRMIGVDLASNHSTSTNVSLAPMGDGIKQQADIEEKDESSRRILTNEMEIESQSNEQFKEFMNNPFKNNSSSDLSEWLFKGFGKLNSSGENLSPAIMKILFELKILKKELSDITLSQSHHKIDMTKVSKPKGKGARANRRLMLQQINKVAILEERREAIEKKIAVLQQRLSLKQKRLAKAKQRSSRKEKTKLLDQELSKIPRYNTISEKLQEKSIISSDFVSMVADFTAEAMNLFPNGKVREEKIIEYTSRKIKEINEERKDTSMNDCDIVSMIKAIIEETKSTDQEIDYMNFPKNRETYLFHPLKPEEQVELNNLCKEFRSVLVSNDKEIRMGKANPEFAFDIELKEGGLEELAKRKQRAYPCKQVMKDMLRQALAEMEMSGVGYRDPNSSCCAFPGFMVKRPRSDKLRLCVDYTDLNRVTKDLVYPLPRIDDIVESMRGSISSASST